MKLEELGNLSLKNILPVFCNKGPRLDPTISMAQLQYFFREYYSSVLILFLSVFLCTPLSEFHI